MPRNDCGRRCSRYDLALAHSRLVRLERTVCVRIQATRSVASVSRVLEGAGEGGGMKQSLKNIKSIFAAFGMCALLSAAGHAEKYSNAEFAYLWLAALVLWAIIHEPK